MTKIVKIYNFYKKHDIIRFIQFFKNFYKKLLEFWSSSSGFLGVPKINIFKNF